MNKQLADSLLRNMTHDRKMMFEILFTAFERTLRKSPCSFLWGDELNDIHLEILKIKQRDGALNEYNTQGLYEKIAKIYDKYATFVDTVIQKETDVMKRQEELEAVTQLRDAAQQLHALGQLKPEEYCKLCERMVEVGQKGASSYRNTERNG